MLYTQEDLQRKIRFAAKKLEYEYNKMYSFDNLSIETHVDNSVLNIQMILTGGSCRGQVFKNVKNVFIFDVSIFQDMLAHSLISVLCEMLKSVETNTFTYKTQYEWSLPKLHKKLLNFIKHQHYDLVL